ncbi:hypothetical protein KIN20_016262, partial [Parelaphostrongylus tenuis]
KFVAPAPLRIASNQSRDSTPLPSFTYDEGNHHLNKLSEDKRVLEEAAEYAKGLERTTVSVRRDTGRVATTASPVIGSQSIPAIITPRTATNDKKQQGKQASLPFSQ